MSALVVDNSVIVHALVEARTDVVRQRLSAPRALHAPHLIDYEFTNALNGLVLSRKLKAKRADQARMDFADLRIQRYPGAVTADRTWELRHNFTGYDAAYIALAELLGCPLLTGDVKLIGSHRANIELHPRP